MFHTFRLFLFIVIIFGSTVLNGSTYNDTTLNIFSKIVPRLILMGSQKEKVKDEINICLLHDEIDERPASLLINDTNNNYPNGIKNYKIVFTKTNYLNIQRCQNSQLIFLFNTDKTKIQKTLIYSQQNKILTISYDQKYLEDGVDISLFLGRKIVPYINTNTIHKKNIMLNNTLLRISKIYAKGAN